MGMQAYLAAIDRRTHDDFRTDPDLILDFAGQEPGDRLLELDKMWHAIHSMLTGKSKGGEAPLADAVMGGDEIGEDLELGPARILSPTQVREIAAALTALDTGTFKRRYNAQQIYPSGIWENEKDKLPDYLADLFDELTQFYAAAAARGDGVLLWMS